MIRKLAIGVVAGIGILFLGFMTYKSHQSSEQPYNLESGLTKDQIKANSEIQQIGVGVPL